MFKVFKYAKQTIEWTRSKLTKKQFIFLASILVGISAGLAAITLKLFAHFIYINVSTTTLIDSKYFYIIFPVLGILFTVLVVKYMLKGKLEKGVSSLHVFIKKKSSVVPREHMYAQILTSSLTVGFGGSAGLEAPIVMTGAAYGSNFAKTHKLSQKDRTLLLACGVSAGIGAAFNAPIAGVLFALEVLLLDVGITAFIPLIIAAASGALMSKIVLHEDVLLSFKSTTPFDYVNVHFYILLGVLCGLIAVYHQRMFNRVEKLVHHLKINYITRVLIGGLFLAVLILMFPSLYGEGYDSIKSLSNSQELKIFDNSVFQNYVSNHWILLLFIVLIIFIKSIATGLTIGAGGNGGNFAPSLFVGAYLGFFISKFLNTFTYFKLPESNFTLVGMAGILSGLYHAPLTAIFLIAEITGGYTLMIPLMIVSSISFAISKYFEPFSMETKKIAQEEEIVSFDRDKDILTSIKVKTLVDRDYTKINPEFNLGQLVEVIKHAEKNIYPVIHENGDFYGIILMDQIKEVMFSRELYDTVYVNELLFKPKTFVDEKDSLDKIMKKMEENDFWFLPVIFNGKFEGFISKTKILSTYRTKLINTTLD